MLLAPLHPLADVIDLTGEAVAAVVTVAAGALTDLLLDQRTNDSHPDPGDGRYHTVRLRGPHRLTEARARVTGGTS